MLTAENINYQDATGATPLIAACRYCPRYKENEGAPFVEFLIHNGVIVDNFYRNNKTAYDYAENNGLHKIYTYIALESNYQAIKELF